MVFVLIHSDAPYVIGFEEGAQYAHEVKVSLERKFLTCQVYEVLERPSTGQQSSYTHQLRLQHRKLTCNTP